MSPRLRESCHSLAFSSARSLSTDNISFSSFEVLSSYPVHQHHHHLHHNPNHHHLTKYLFQNLPKVLGGSHEPPDYPLPPQPTPSYQGFLPNFTFCPNIFLGQSSKYVILTRRGRRQLSTPVPCLHNRLSPLPRSVRASQPSHPTRPSTKLDKASQLQQAPLFQPTPSPNQPQPQPQNPKTPSGGL